MFPVPSISRTGSGIVSFPISLQVAEPLGECTLYSCTRNCEPCQPRPDSAGGPDGPDGPGRNALIGGPDVSCGHLFNYCLL